MRKEEKKADEKPLAPAPKDQTSPTINAGIGGKVEGGMGMSGPANVGGPAVAPPGFEDARRKFEEALKNKKP